MGLLQTILSKEELARIIYRENRGHKAMQVDLHGLTCKQAMRFLRNIIALFREPFTMKIVHGYIHGTRIKEMILSEEISKRVSRISSDISNPGVTMLNIA